MENQPQRKWYFKTSSLIVAFLCVGPLMLPLIWLNPGLSKKIKIIIITAVIILTYLLGAWAYKSYNSIINSLFQN